MAKFSVDTKKVKVTPEVPFEVLHLDEELLILACPITGTETGKTGGIIRFKSSGYKKLNDNLSFNGVVVGKPVAKPRTTKGVSDPISALEDRLQAILKELATIKK